METKVQKITKQEYEALAKAARNAAYLSKLDAAIAQLDAGRGQEHELIEVIEDPGDEKTLG
jgi:antitoxin YefM